MAQVELAFDDRGAGDPIVLLHAFPTDRTLWADVAAELASSECRIITPDLRGFGGSPLGTDAPDLDRVADDVIALLDRLQLPQAVIGGLSLGGYVTLNVLRRHPERISALLLVDTKAAADDAAAQTRREQMAQTVERTKSTTDYIDGWTTTLIGNTSRLWRPAVTERVREWGRTTSPATVAWYQRAMAARPASFDALETCAVPALVVVGTQDEITPLADAEAMRVATPAAVLAVIAASGHLSALEAPEAVTAAVRDFLATR